MYKAGDIVKPIKQFSNGNALHHIITMKVISTWTSLSEMRIFCKCRILATDKTIKTEYHTKEKNIIIIFTNSITYNNSNIDNFPIY